MEGGLVTELLIVVAVAAAGVALFERLGLPAIAGFLVMGALLGPGALGIVNDPDRVRALAELGVVFLLFEIGLELPIERVRRMWKAAATAGALQVVGTLGAGAAVAHAFGAPWATSIVVGALITMSSTALVIGLLQERGEVDAPHGQLAVGILLFQDLCIVPFLLAIPILAGETAFTPHDIALTLGKALLGIAALFAAARFLVPLVLVRVVHLRSRELFSLVGLLLVIGTAVVAEEIGLTLAVGAFVGGIVAATSPYSYQLFSEIVPLRGVFLGLFFTAIGMLLDPSTALDLSMEVLGYVTAVVLGKALLIAVVILFLLRRSPRTAILSGLALAQTGEFSFVLATEASDAGLLGARFQQVFVAGSVITLIATPFLMRAGPVLVRWLATKRGVPVGSVQQLRQSDELRDHGVVIGFGLAGRNVARVLRAIDVPYIATETNPTVVEEAQARNERIVYGDATRRPLLERLGIEHARFVVVAVSDPIATREVVTLVRTLAPNTRILVKTRYILELDPLSATGADIVVAEELEGTVDLVAEVLRQCTVAEGAIARFTGELREEGYQALRAPPGMGLDPWLAEILEQIPTDWVDVPESIPSHATLESLGVRAQTGASVLVVERGSRSFPGPPADFALEPGDRLLIFGSVDAVDRLQALLHEAR